MDSVISGAPFQNTKTDALHGAGIQNTERGSARGGGDFVSAVMRLRASGFEDSARWIEQELGLCSRPAVTKADRASFRRVAR
jgi:hypothetical protein